MLMSDRAQIIDFRLDNIHVDGSAFKLAAFFLGSKPGSQAGTSFAFGGLAADRGARYEDNTNTFRFPADMYPVIGWDRSTIVHESAHCWRDIIHGTVVNSDGRRARPLMLSEEAGAFVAEYLFFLADNPPKIIFSINTGTNAQFNQSTSNFGPVFDAVFSVELHIRRCSRPGRD